MSFTSFTIPIHCPKCSQLTFLITKREAGENHLLSFSNDEWRHHGCLHSINDDKLKNEAVEQALEGKKQLVRLNFMPADAGRPLKNRPLTVGVILEFNRLESKTNLTILTPEEQVIQVRLTDNTSPLSAGLVVNLANLKRVGPNRYRLKEIEEIDLLKLVKTIADSETQAIIQCYLSALDLERLEMNLNRLIDYMDKEQQCVLNVIPKSLFKTRKGLHFSREVCFIVRGKILETQDRLKSFPFSNEVDVKVQLMK